MSLLYLCKVHTITKNDPDVYFFRRGIMTTVTIIVIIRGIITTV